MARKNNAAAWKSYNGEPLREGEVLVPMMVDDLQYAIDLGAKRENLRTWKTIGVSFAVMFVPVPADQEAISKGSFYAGLKELLDEKRGPNRFARCMIPQADGSKKVCPKCQNGNHLPCAACPYKDLYERENKSMISIEELKGEEYKKHMYTCSAESEAMMELLFDDLQDYLHDIEPALEQVVTLGFQGFDRKEIVQQLPGKKTRTYQTYARAEKLARDFLLK